MVDMVDLDYVVYMVEMVDTVGKVDMVDMIDILHIVGMVNKEYMVIWLWIWQIPAKSEAALMAAHFVDQFPGCSSEGAHCGYNTLVS